MQADRPRTQGDIVLITGVMAAGKSTVAQALANALPRSVHLRGDTFRRMIVNGVEPMSPDPTPEALAQLMLRYQATASVASQFAAAGFTVVCQDVIIGSVLTDAIALYPEAALKLVVLCPRPEVVALRESNRSKTGYGAFSVDQLYEVFTRGTPQVGFWLDSSDLSIDQCVAAIADRYNLPIISTPA